MTIETKVQTAVNKSRKHNEDGFDPIMTGMISVPGLLLLAASAYAMLSGSEVGPISEGYDSGLVETMSQEGAYAVNVAYE